MILSEILRNTLFVLRVHLISLVSATSLYILIAIGINSLLQISTQSSESFPILLLLPVVEMVLSALITFAGLRYFLNSEDGPLEINRTKILNYIFTAFFISIATTLGFLLLIIPGIIIVSVSILYPVYILKDNDGVFKSIDKSIDALKGNLVTVCLAVCIFYFCLYLLTYVVAFVFQLVSLNAYLSIFIGNILSYLLGLILIPFIFVIYEASNETSNKEVVWDSGDDSPPTQT